MSTCTRKVLQTYLLVVFLTKKVQLWINQCHIFASSNSDHVPFFSSPFYGKQPMWHEKLELIANFFSFYWQNQIFDWLPLAQLRDIWIIFSKWRKYTPALPSWDGWQRPAPVEAPKARPLWWWCSGKSPFHPWAIWGWCQHVTPCNESFFFWHFSHRKLSWRIQLLAQYPKGRDKLNFCTVGYTLLFRLRSQMRTQG